MDEPTEKVDEVPESPKPMAFTIDFGERKNVDTQRFKHLVEKYQNRHRRGQSLSKLEDGAAAVKKPLTGNLPRKSSFHSEGYFSSDEKPIKGAARSTVLNTVILKGDLSLPLRNISAGDRMTQSFPSRNFDLPSISSPELELKDVSSPELELISPCSPLVQSSLKLNSTTLVTQATRFQHLHKQYSSPEVETKTLLDDEFANETFICGTDFDFEDTVSDAGTYTLDADNYTEEQKAKMSIDAEFNIEQISVSRKTEEYVRSLSLESPVVLVPPETPQICENNVHVPHAQHVSPTHVPPAQHMSPTQHVPPAQHAKLAQNLSQNTVQCGTLQHAKTPTETDQATRITKKIFNKIMYPSPKGQADSSAADLGVFTSITASGVLSKRPERRGHERRSSLVQSEIFVEAYTGGETKTSQKRLIVEEPKSTLSAGRPPPIGGKSSPTKIPSPAHTLTRPRSRNSLSSQNIDGSDSSLETESYLKPTQNIITSLQARLSLDSDQESDYDKNYVALNNETKNLIKNKPMHVRHNSFDDRNIKISNKLEHFHHKNLQSIDQTYKSCNQSKSVHRIQNSPNNSPIRRSSSFSLKNQFDNQPKCLNTKESNTAYNYQRNGSVQRSSSTANIKDQYRRASASSELHKPLPQYETESSSDEEFDKTFLKNKRDLTTTRYNRAFCLRRARLDEPAVPVPKCPNTPEMRRKFVGGNEKQERGVSVDRKKVPDVQSRYMNIAKTKTQPVKVEPPKSVPKPICKPNKQPVFSRTDTGRFSMRTTKPPTNSAPKPNRPQGKKQSGPRSNSTLSSREVEFQNWKRRKSYDPMKAAAEGKRKAEAARKVNQMTQSYNEDCDDSSASHSGSVHRSQSFHGTAALDHLISTDEDDDLTLSGDDERYSPPTPSPPTKGRHVWMERFKR